MGNLNPIVHDTKTWVRGVNKRVGALENVGSLGPAALVGTTDPAYVGTGIPLVFLANGASVLPVSFPLGSVLLPSQQVLLLRSALGWHIAELLTIPHLAAPLQGVIPSSVVVDTGSATVAADGTVSFSGCSTVALNGVFNGVGADEYMAIVSVTTSVAATVSSRVRAAGVTQATAYNYAATFTQLATGPTRSAGTAQSSFGWLVPSAGTGSNIGVAAVFIHQPAKPVTTFINNHSVASAGGDRYEFSEGGDSGNATVNDAWALVASTGTIQGTVKVMKLA